MKKTVLALMAAVFILSVGVGTADAAWITGFATAKKILQNAGATTLTSVSGATAIVYKLGAGETLNTDDTVTLTLTGGLKFSSTAPTITTSAGAMSIVGSPTGLTSANFRVAFLANVDDTLTLNTDGVIFDVSAVTTSADISMKAVTAVGSLTIFDKLQSTAPAATAAFSAPSAMERTSAVATTDQVKVASTPTPYTKFAAGGVAGTAATLNFTNLAEDANTIPGKSISIAKVVFGIEGSLTGIASIGGTGVTGSSATGSTVGGTANQFLINTAKTNAYASNTAAVGRLAQLLVAPTFNIDGTTAQSARGFNATISVQNDGTTYTAHTAMTATPIYSITRDGSSFATNSVGPRNTIKISERSNALQSTGGAVTITAYDVDGNLLGASSTAPVLTILNNKTLTITGTDLAARFVGAPMRYEFAIESGNIVVTNVKQSTDGTMTATTIYSTTAGQGI